MRHHQRVDGDHVLQLDVPAVGYPVLRIIDRNGPAAASALLSRPAAIELRDWLNQWLGDTTLPGPTS
jgi:hypothetical protein